REDRVHTSIGMSISNVRAMSQGGFANGKGSWLVAARQGFLQYLLKLAQIDDSLRPRYGDLFGKISYNVRGTTFSAHALHATDRLNYLQTSKPAINSKYLSDYAWLTAAGRVGTHLRQESVLWTNALNWHRGGFEDDPR